MSRKIITKFEHPPIPLRHLDWVAIYEGDEEDGLRGWGSTEQEAIENLKNQESE
jgi:hypothetical protein